MPKPIDHTLAQAIVDTIHEPLIALDEKLHVVVASRSFYRKFHTTPDMTEGRLFSELGEGQWNIPALHLLLDRITPDNGVLEGYEVELDFPKLGRRILLLNARRVYYADGQGVNILLAIEDITEKRAIERERDELLHEKDMLLEEIQHRVANSLAIIASIMLLKARAITSPETRAHLEDAHKRVMSVATVQKHLHPSETGVLIEMGLYLEQLCSSLTGSMINSDFCVIETQVSESQVTSAEAVSVGLIVTELVINALKYAFPDRNPGSVILVGYETNETDWKLSVTDNGVGTGVSDPLSTGSGLGTNIVKALANQLDANIEMKSSPAGTSVLVTHTTFRSSTKAV